MELLAELLAFASGAFLLRPAWRINGVMRDSAALRKILQSSTAKVDQETLPVVVAELDKKTSSWDLWDDRCIKLGLALFLVSGFIKLMLVWGKA